MTEESYPQPETETMFEVQTDTAALQPSEETLVPAPEKQLSELGIIKRGATVH